MKQASCWRGVPPFRCRHERPAVGLMTGNLELRLRKVLQEKTTRFGLGGSRERTTLRGAPQVKRKKPNRVGWSFTSRLGEEYSVRWEAYMYNPFIITVLFPGPKRPAGPIGFFSFHLTGNQSKLSFSSSPGRNLASPSIFRSESGSYYLQKPELQVPRHEPHSWALVTAPERGDATPTRSLLHGVSRHQKMRRCCVIWLSKHTGSATRNIL